MSGRRGHSLPPQIMEKPTRGPCVRAICISWKVLTCIVSHVTLISLVVAYCLGGAYLFQFLEQPHEVKVKKGIKDMRLNITDSIWRMTEAENYLEEGIWIRKVKEQLTTLEKQVLTAMKTHGWDGNEDLEQSQWTFAGALFYSIIVITTIGYGHISPRTEWGKVCTIFYAIVGIPLMLLCLSNIGDVMATSFRFTYWRVCCYVCSREPRRNRRSRGRSRSSYRYSSRSQPPPFRRSMKISPRSADSGFGTYDHGLSHAYSDPELRTVGRMEPERDFYRGGSYQPQHHHHHHHHHQPGRGLPPRDHRGGASRQTVYEEEYDQRGSINRNSRFSSRQRTRDRMRDRHTVERERNIGRSRQQFDSTEDFEMPSHKRAQSVRSMRVPTQNPRDMNRNYSQTLPANTRGRSMPNAPKTRAKSVDPRSSAHYEDVDEEVVRKTPILCNRYAIDELDRRLSHEHRHNKTNPRSQSMPRHPKTSMDQPMHAPGTPHSQRRGSLNGPMPSRYGNRLELPEPTSRSHNRHQQQRRPSRYEDFEEDFDDFEGSYDDLPTHVPPARERERERDRRPRRERQEPLPPSPRIMSPMGFAVRRQTRARPVYDDDDSYFEEEWDSYGDISPKDRPVPIWLCVFLVISYIIAGAFLFHQWEGWTFLDSAYFCFITLTTIGFGDYVPARGVKENSQESIALCSLYLLFGIALLAMSFNLVQEEFIANVKEVARRLGILKEEEDEDD